MSEDATTPHQKEKSKTARILGDDHFPRAECLSCTHQWEPRTLKPKRGYFHCPHCSSKFTQCYDKKGKLIIKPPESKVSGGETKASHRDKRQKYIVKNGQYCYADTGMPVPPLFIEDELIDERIEDNIRSSSHVNRKGIAPFPELDTKSTILLYAKAIESGFEEDNLHEFTAYLLRLYDAFDQIKVYTGQIDPKMFPDEFAVLIEMALDSRRMKTEMQEMEQRINRYEKARELLNVHVDEGIDRQIDQIGDSDLVDRAMKELANFSD